METARSEAQGPGGRPPWLGLVVYIVVAFGLAWAIELGPVRRMGLTSGRLAVVVLMIGVMFAPSVAAVLARLMEGSGFGDARLRWGRGRYHLVAWVLPFGVAVAALGLTLALGLGRLDLSMTAALERLPAVRRDAAAAQLATVGPWLPLLVVVGALTQGVLITCIATFGEEFGWRSYLQQRLSRLGRVESMLAVGAIWGIWHAPVIVQGHNYPGHPLAGVFLMVAFCMAWAIILGWLFEASRSVLAPTIAHASLNSPAASLIAFVAGADPALGHITGAVGIVLAGCVVLWLWWTGRLGESAESENDTAADHPPAWTIDD